MTADESTDVAKLDGLRQKAIDAILAHGVVPGVSAASMDDRECAVVVAKIAVRGLRRLTEALDSIAAELEQQIAECERKADA